MIKTQINPANLQEMLDSAPNAAQKGQAQYLTPVPWAAALARALPQYRPCLTDFTCGYGTLLAGAAGPSTDYLLGCDIEAPPSPDEWMNGLLDGSANNPAIQQSSNPASLLARRVTADFTLFFKLLHAVKWQFDVGVFNAPWDLHHYRARLAMLEDSYCPAVRYAFAAHDGRTGADTIDSTVLVMAMALDRMTHYGEAFIIGNQATLDRLILLDDSPHVALRAHVWQSVVIPGNICDPARSLRTATNNGPSGTDTDFQTGILYFARDHTTGFDDQDTLVFGLEDAPEQVGHILSLPDVRIKRCGARLRPGAANADTARLWTAAKEEWAVQHPVAGGFQPVGSSPEGQRHWNLWLDATNGTICTNLSTYDDASGRVNKAEASRLYALNGQHPMHLVMARESRKELLHALNGDRWRVAPAVAAAVAKAIEDYNRERAPLYPLNKIQRLGYIEEQDTILCLKDLGKWFNAGDRYVLRMETIRVTRNGTKMNLEGALDDVQYDGSELAIFIESPDGERLFMEARHMDASVKLSIQDVGKPSPIHFTLQQLVDHFEIPEVPDVATINPDGYNLNLQLLHEIEQLVA
jgi:hypothetical protein